MFGCPPGKTGQNPSMKLQNRIDHRSEVFSGIIPRGLHDPRDREGMVCGASPRGVDTNSGDAEHPFATINKGAGIARAGDTVWVSPGTYQPADIGSGPARSGTADSPITYRARGGEVIIDGRGKVPNYPWDGVFTIGKRVGLSSTGFT